MWLDIDSSLQTNDSKWLDSFCGSTLTQPIHESDSTLTRRACDSDSTKNDSGTSLQIPKPKSLSLKL